MIQQKMFTKILLAFCGIACALAIVEVCGRLAHFLPGIPSDAYIKLTNLVGPLPDPSSLTLSRSPQDEYNAWLDFNAFGFRDPTLDFVDSAQPGSLRILALGDSYTSAWQVPLEQRWTEQMVALHPGWSTFNLGQPGWGMDQEYLTYLNYPLRKPPDVTVLLFFTGDVWRNARLLLTGAAPNYPYFVPKETGSLTRFDQLRQVTAWHYDDPFDVPSRLSFPSNVRAWLSLHSVTYRAASNAWKTLHAAYQNTPAPPQSPAQTSASTLPVDLNVFDPNAPATWQTAWQITDALLKQMQTLAQSRGTHFAIVMIPYYATVQPELVLPYLTANATRLDYALPYQHMAQFASANGIPLLDLTPSFVQFHQNDPQHRDLFFKVDRHFTSLGNCLAAVQITNWLDPATSADMRRCR